MLSLLDPSHPWPHYPHTPGRVWLFFKLFPFLPARSDWAARHRQGCARSTGRKEACSKAVNRERGWDAAAGAALATTTEAAGRLHFALRLVRPQRPERLQPAGPLPVP